MLKHAIFVASCLATLPAAPLRADILTLEQALTGICLPAMPELYRAPDGFIRAGWQAFPGGGPGEYEFHKGETHVYLITAEAGMVPGCTVTDESAAPLAVEWLVELWLDKEYPAQWERRADEWGNLWRVQFPNGTLAFRQNEPAGQEGRKDTHGAAISVEFQ